MGQKTPLRTGTGDRRVLANKIVRMARAFSSEVDTGSREENASNQKIRARFR